MKIKLVITLIISCLVSMAFSQSAKLTKKAHLDAEKIIPKVIEWRHDIHEHPELSNLEFKTAAKVAQHLKDLGLEVEEGVAKTGVVGILVGDQPGPVIALRADMDGLPVTERVELPWASKATSIYNDKATGVMHACGHDTHVAILMGVAEVLSGLKKDLKGTVKFIFQPAEEGAPPGEEGGAKLMIKEGVMMNPKVEVAFGLHISADTPEGILTYKPGGILAAADRFVIQVNGKQSHGSQPWASIDPIVTSAQIINGIQTIISRQTELTKEGAVITVGMINSGIRNNIIPESAEMIGTIRTLDTQMQDKIHADLIRTATKIGESMGAQVTVDIEREVPVTFNDPALTTKAANWLNSSLGPEHVQLQRAITGAEDFSFFAEKVPSFFFFIGGCPKGSDPSLAAPHHTPDFYVTDSSMITGVKALLGLTLGYMNDPLK
jgi:amidohydrolase|tara:strand:- start:897 stop:2204 length:1308 start_codon:yes stop_codon:yes gene_type:complete